MAAPSKVVCVCGFCYAPAPKTHTPVQSQTSLAAVVCS